MKENANKLALGIFICLGLVVSGWFIGSGLKSFSDKDKVVTVKGLSEKIVDADHASLSIAYEVGGNDMQMLLQNIEKNNKIVVDFIKSKGLKDSEIVLGVPKIRDKSVTEYGDYEFKGSRYYASVSISMYSNNAKAVRDVEMSQFDLYKNGVTIKQQEYYEGRIRYYEFTKINDLKPSLIKESTENAKKAALELAENTGGKLGKIKNASQGQISIESTENPLKLKVRVVSTISYFLK